MEELPKPKHGRCFRHGDWQAIVGMEPIALPYQHLSIHGRGAARDRRWVTGKADCSGEAIAYSCKVGNDGKLLNNYSSGGNPEHWVETGRYQIQGRTRSRGSCSSSGRGAPPAN